MLGMDGKTIQLDFPVIDAHVHLYPDFLAKRVTPDLAGRFGNTPSFNGTMDGFLSLPLGRDEQSAICYGNAAKLFGIVP